MPLPRIHPRLALLTRNLLRRRILDHGLILGSYDKGKCRMSTSSTKPARPTHHLSHERHVHQRHLQTPEAFRNPPSSRMRGKTLAAVERNWSACHARKLSIRIPALGWRGNAGRTHPPSFRDTTFSTYSCLRRSRGRHCSRRWLLGSLVAVA